MSDALMLVGYKSGDDLRPSGSPWWLWVLTLLLLGGVVFLQQQETAEPVKLEERWAAARGTSEIRPPRVSQLIMMGRVLIGAKYHAPSMGPQLLESVETQIGLRRDGTPLPPAPGPAPPLPTLPVDRPGAAEQGLQEGSPDAYAEAGDEEPLDAATATPAARPPPAAQDRFRVTILAAEVYGPDRALDRLDELQADVAAESPLRLDIAIARVVYTDGPEAVDPLARDELVARHGWFGELLFSFDKPRTDPFRAQEIAAARSMLLIFAALGLLGTLAVVLGIAVLIIGLVLLGGGNLRPRFIRPAWGSRVWLETFAIFVAGFLLLKLTGKAVERWAPPDAAWRAWFGLGAQWVLLLLVFWPVLRGLSFQQFRGEVGWHRGRGFFPEVGAGILGYLAALPIYLLVAVMIAMVMYLRRSEDADPPAPDTRIMEALENANLGVALLLVSLVVIWAPVVEETIFRGALYRALRSPLGILGAVVLSAVFFAVMHAYIVAGLIMVATLGAVFGLMREWRNSIIAPMIAHGMHNGFILTVMIAMWHFSRP